MAVKTAVRSKAKKGRAKTKPKVRPRAASRSSTKARVAELGKFREQLLEERARLEVELREIEARTARVDESERANELSAYEDHPADLASETFEREKDLAIGESVQSMLHKVINALEKIDRGTYGLCDACGRPIKKARLNALPFATLCLDCQDRLER
jgi:RNA polymerase-binding protein DksA